MKRIWIVALALLFLGAIVYVEWKIDYRPNPVVSHPADEVSKNDLCVLNEKVIPCPPMATGNVSAPIAVKSTSSETPHDYIAELRVEARKRGLKWRIWCVDFGGDWNFEASAAKSKTNEIKDMVFIDGWQAHGTNQQETAMNLMEVIKCPENWKAIPHSIPHTKKCPPELSGN
jgi:hypothetical protein